MAEYPGFTVWTDAYLGDTNHLTTLEHGAYLLLLFTMWRAGGSLPKDDKKLARYAKLSPGQWSRIKDTVMEFFTEADGSITQSRLTKELEFVRQRSNRQSQNARAKSLKDNDRVEATVQPRPSHSPAPTLTPTPTLTKEDSSLRSLGEHVENDDVKLAFDAWNILAAHVSLPKAETLNTKRKSSLRQRLKECGGIEGWKDALRLIPQSPFLMGENNTGFTATLDFILQASSFTKLREGNYAKRGNGPAAQPKKGLALIREQLRQEISDAGFGGEENSDSQTIQRLAFDGGRR